MPKIPQIVLPEGHGRGRRLMVRAKKTAKRKTVVVTVYDPNAPHRFYPEVKGEWIAKQAPIDGALRGTKRVPKANAIKSPITGKPQTSELLVQVGQNLAGLPISDAELYWQKGEIRTGWRFVPDKEVKPPLDPQPAQPRP